MWRFKEVVSLPAAEMLRTGTPASAALSERRVTMEEAAAYFGIGQNCFRELLEDENCRFVHYIGSKRLIKRRAVFTESAF